MSELPAAFPPAGEPSSGNQSVTETGAENLSRRPASLFPALACLVALLLGAAIAWATAPSLLANLPNDHARIGVLLRALRAPGPPRLVVIGNSVAMFGLDTRALGPGAWNLATSAQTLPESAILLDALPAGTRNVVLLLTPWHLDSPEPLDAETWNAWWLYGAHPSSELRALLSDACGPQTAALLATPPSTQRFRARWVVRAAIEAIARDALTRDQDRGRLEADLYHPASSTATAETFVQPQRARGQERRLRDYRPDPSETRLLEGMASLAARRGKHLTILLAPLSPAIRAGYTPDALMRFEATRVPRATTIDATRALPAARDFIDLTHPNAEGAARLGAFVAARLPTAR